MEKTFTSSTREICKFCGESFNSEDLAFCEEPVCQVCLDEQEYQQYRMSDPNPDRSFL